LHADVPAALEASIGVDDEPDRLDGAFPEGDFEQQ